MEVILEPLIVTFSLTRILVAEASFAAKAGFGFSERIATLPGFTLAFATAVSGLPLRLLVTARSSNLHPRPRARLGHLT